MKKDCAQFVKVSTAEKSSNMTLPNNYTAVGGASRLGRHIPLSREDFGSLMLFVLSADSCQQHPNK